MSPNISAMKYNYDTPIKCHGITILIKAISGNDTLNKRHEIKKNTIKNDPFGKTSLYIPI